LIMKNKGVVFGSIAGALTVGFYLVLYFVDKNHLLDPWATYLPFVFYLGAMYMASRQSALETEGPFPWKDALRIAFLVYLVANAWFYAFYYLIHQFDPSLADLQKELMRASLPQYTEPGKLSQAYEELETHDFKVSLGDAIFGWARGAILGFGLAALVALVTRKENH
jgi:hypothetical protein